MTTAPILGIDADTRRIAWALLRDGAVAGVGTLDREDSRGQVLPAYDRRLDQLLGRAAEIGAAVYLEGLYLAGKGRGRSNVLSFRRLSETRGEVLRAARMAGVPSLVTVAPRVWQMRVLGFSTDREAIKAASHALAQSMVARGLSEHEADAVCIARFAWLQAHEGVAC